MVRTTSPATHSSFLGRCDFSGFANHHHHHGRMPTFLPFKFPSSQNMVTVMSIAGELNAGLQSASGEREISLLNDGPAGQSIAGAVVALGKFEALHIGHRALAVQASKMGDPVLLSFAGMAEVLKWEKRLPVVAPCDRKRVMSLWRAYCAGKVPQEYQLDFSKVRSLSPFDFVQKLAKELHVKGVVAGANYRFGYKAAGDTSDLTQLCSKFGLDVFIVDPVMDVMEKPNGLLKKLGGANNRDTGQVSSTRVRNALNAGKVKRVAELLGREHRLIFKIDDCTMGVDTIHVQLSNALNLVPSDGIYSSRICLSSGGITETCVANGMNVIVAIKNEQLMVQVNRGAFKSAFSGQRFLCLDLQCKVDRP